MQNHMVLHLKTVARWMKTTLKEAGIEDFVPHSFRGAAASAMLSSGMTLEDVMKKAGWSNALTFKKFYHKPVLNGKMKNAGNDGSQGLISKTL